MPLSGFKVNVSSFIIRNKYKVWNVRCNFLLLIIKKKINRRGKTKKNVNLITWWIDCRISSSPDKPTSTIGFEWLGGATVCSTSIIILELVGKRSPVQMSCFFREFSTKTSDCTKDLELSIMGIIIPSPDTRLGNERWAIFCDLTFELFFFFRCFFRWSKELTAISWRRKEFSCLSNWMGTSAVPEVGGLANAIPDISLTSLFTCPAGNFCGTDENRFVRVRRVYRLEFTTGGLTDCLAHPNVVLTKWGDEGGGNMVQ